MIYAVEILDRKFVKIGFTDSGVASRIATLQTGSPFEIKKILEVDGTLLQEKELHRTLLAMFTRIRIPVPPNEWYPGRSPVFTEFLGALSYSVATGIYYLDKYNQTVKQPGKGVTSLAPNVKWPILKSRDL